jgi:hypothetical protein
MERVPLSYTVTSAPLLRMIAMEAFFCNAIRACTAVESHGLMNFSD